MESLTKPSMISTLHNPINALIVIMKGIISVKRENFSAEREKVNADLISLQSEKMIKEMIEASPRTTLQSSFYQLALKTGLEAGQIKRLYYGEWRVIPAHIWEQVKWAHRQVTERALLNMEHRQQIMRQRIEAFDSRLKQDEERRHALSEGSGT